MSGEVTVRPKAEAAHQKALESKFLGYQKQIKDPSSDGLRPRAYAALLSQSKATRTELQNAAVLASKGATAATDIGDGDEQSGEKIQAC